MLNSSMHHHVNTSFSIPMEDSYIPFFDQISPSNIDRVSDYRQIGHGFPTFDPFMHFFSPSLTTDMIQEPDMFDPPISETGTMKQNYDGKKRKRMQQGGSEKPKEVVHVRAKRGQATDSHSLAERIRREKINERLRCLQDLVPGCYKTMGMAVMLDVIINYVRSLQNQIDFLSMKLSAASLFYDFNSLDGEAMATTLPLHGNVVSNEGVDHLFDNGVYGRIPYYYP